MWNSKIEGSSYTNYSANFPASLESAPIYLLPQPLLEKILVFLKAKDLESTCLVDRFWGKVSVNIGRKKELFSEIEFVRWIIKNLSESKYFIQIQQLASCVSFEKILGLIDLGELKPQLRKKFIHILKNLAEEDLNHLLQLIDKEVNLISFKPFMIQAILYHEKEKAQGIKDPKKSCEQLVFVSRLFWLNGYKEEAMEIILGLAFLIHNNSARDRHLVRVADFYLKIDIFKALEVIEHISDEQSYVSKLSIALETLLKLFPLNAAFEKILEVKNENLREELLELYIERQTKDNHSDIPK